jgi:hypothetical protein
VRSTGFFLWDPLIAGQAQQKLALMLIKGQKIDAGLDLGLLATPI